jgi:hypothetical protein
MYSAYVCMAVCTCVCIEVCVSVSESVCECDIYEAFINVNIYTNERAFGQNIVTVWRAYNHIRMK